MADVRACPVSNEDFFFSIYYFFEVLCVRAIFSEFKSEDHKVTGSKPVSVRMLFRRLPGFWGRPRETSEG